ncbi:MAG: tRNA lysidine(34) synthetase TilS [Elusimicrobium sp.]|jgi:tRNA(Ile)-lysidine synthase|nr:tRNA lysidine(34) synthetase TilS [Elusimicrobium sp.]
MEKIILLKNEFYSKIWAKLLNENSKVFRRGDRVLAGVSGGADSVALLHFLKKLSEKNRFALYACHVNHNLRKNAKRDEIFTKKFCDSIGVECVVCQADVKKIAREYNLSAEHAARKARYRAFEAACRRKTANFLALAHHADDNAETLLLNILRGTKAKGLAGITARRPLNKTVTLVRPLLGIRRKDIEDYIKFNKLKFVMDETNMRENFTRNWVRRRLLPMLEKKQPRVREHLNMISCDLAKIYENR